jgi:hypothetical protein
VHNVSGSITFVHAYHRQANCRVQGA